MSEIVDIDKARLEIKAKKGFKNLSKRFEHNFGSSTRMENIPDRALAFLAEGGQESTDYYYDLIMGLKGLDADSGFNILAPADKMAVIDIHLFLLDRARYEYMKRLGWLDSYPGERHSVVELVMSFGDLAPDIQARPPVLSASHPCYDDYISKNLFEKEVIIRKLIPEALNKIFY